MSVSTTWHQRMQIASLALVEATLEERVKHIKQEYVLYDPMYDYQPKQNNERIAFGSSHDAVTEYLEQHAA